MKGKRLTLTLLFCGILCLVFLAGAPTALAHRLNVFALLEGDCINGEAYFNDGSPAKDSKVLIKNSTGHVLAEGKTNENGQFSLKLSSPPTEAVTVIVEGGVGHRGETTVESPKNGKKLTTTTKVGSETPEKTTVQDVPSAAIEEIIKNAVKEEMEPIRNELIKMNMELSKPKVTEILGGIGYIVGLFGVAFWVKGRSKNG